MAASPQAQAIAPGGTALPPPPDPTAADYVEAPVVLAGAHTADGQVTVSGRAAPDSIVRLSAPEGQSWGMTAGGDGQWSFSVPVGDHPRMMALTAEKAGRSVHIDGAVVVLPAPGIPVAVARPGYGARSIGLQSIRPVIMSLDYDGGGGGILAGVARPGSVVHLSIDGLEAAVARTDAQGRFIAPAIKQPLKAGQRMIRVENSDGAAQIQTEVHPPGPLDGIYAARRQADGWRLDWRSGPRAVQSTVIFDSAQQALAGSRP